MTTPPVIEAPVIQAQNLVKRFDQSARPVVDHVDLTVRAGEIYGFLGPNGGGHARHAGAGGRARTRRDRGVEPPSPRRRLTSCG
jgi:ABC-type enterochelin transport system ATPase subunit